MGKPKGKLKKTTVTQKEVLPQIIFNKIQAKQDRKNRFSFHVASFTDQFMSIGAAV